MVQFAGRVLNAIRTAYCDHPVASVVNAMLVLETSLADWYRWMTMVPELLAFVLTVLEVDDEVALCSAR